MSRRIRRIVILALILVTIGCDQLTKRMIRERMADFETKFFPGNHLTLTREENAGAFLSLGDDLPRLARNLLLSVVPTILIGLGLLHLF